MNQLKKRNKERPWGEKQLYFGFLLNSLDFPFPPLVALDMFEKLFSPASFQAGKSSSKSLNLGQPPPLFLGKCLT